MRLLKDPLPRVALVMLSIIASCNVAFSQDQRPNIIYVMVDDMGFADLSCFGRKDYQTPNIDSFVKEGIRFNNAYAGAPVCTPTRVAFMTGQYPARNSIGLREPLTGSPHDKTIGLLPDVPTVSSILKDNGYETALFGKWHLGVNEKFAPRKHGFDHFFGILSGAADYADHRVIDRNAALLLKRKESLLYENDTPVQKMGYLTDLITDYSTAFIRQSHVKPFFLSIQYTSPHWPWQRPDDKPTPDTIPYDQDADPEIFREMVRNLDMNFGKIIAQVKASGLEASTLIIFTSDNGGEKYSSMGPYKGHKLTLWEGGIRVPASVRWPGVIVPAQHSDQLVITMDWTVTILDAASAKYSDTLKFDGITLLPHFRDPGKTVPRQFYWRLSNRVNQEAYRTGDWKYLRTAEGEFLFNLADDPYETTNLKTQRAAKFKTLKAEFAAANAEMLPPLVLSH